MCGGFEFFSRNSSNFHLVLILVLCTLQELPVPLSTAMGQIWRLEVTSVSAVKDGGELDVTIQDIVIVSPKIVAEIPTCVTITGDAFGMKEYRHTIRAVTVILVGNYNCKCPKGKKYCVEHEGTQNSFCSEHGVCNHVFRNNMETGEYESIAYYSTCDVSEL